jgi:hypothetical protein
MVREASRPVRKGKSRKPRIIFDIATFAGSESGTALVTRTEEQAL